MSEELLLLKISNIFSALQVAAVLWYNTIVRKI